MQNMASANRVESKMSHQSDSRFWTGGLPRHERALSAEEKEAIADLKARLALATDPLERQTLQYELRRVREKYKQRQRDSRGALFLEQG